MKFVQAKILRQIAGSDNPADQVKVLRERGLNPFICPRTGRPLVTESAIESVIVSPVVHEFVGNLKAFD